MIPTVKRVIYNIGYLIIHMDRKNVQTFLVCIVVATTLWVFNYLQKEKSEQVSYPITFRFNDKKYMALDTIPKNISLSLKGSGWQILRKMLRFGIKPIVMDISPESQMKQPYLPKNELEDEIQKVLQHVKMDKPLKDTIKFAMDHRYKRVLHLAVDSLKLDLPRDHRVISAVKIYPELVAIEGPKKLVKALPNPYTLDMTNVKVREEQFKKTFQIEIRGIRPDLLIQDEKNVSISFETARFVQKTIKIGINITTPKPRFIPIQLNYIVRESEADKVQASDFVLEIDWSEYQKKDGTAIIRLKTHPREVLKQDVFFLKRVKVE